MPSARTRKLVVSIDSEDSAVLRSLARSRGVAIEVLIRKLIHSAAVAARQAGYTPSVRGISHTRRPPDGRSLRTAAA